jgi:hypothetical protein
MSTVIAPRMTAITAHGGGVGTRETAAAKSEFVADKAVDKFQRMIRKCLPSGLTRG